MKTNNVFISIKIYFTEISMTNASPVLCPTRSKVSALGTNPISFAAPATNDDSFVLGNETKNKFFNKQQKLNRLYLSTFKDMATTVVATGKIEVLRRKQQPIPVGWALDENGVVTTDANVAFDVQRQLPLGGTEMTSGHKGDLIFV